MQLRKLNFFILSTICTFIIIMLIANGFKNNNKFNIINSKQQYDIVIYGSTSAGVIAAIQAARLGRKVVLISEGKHIGGMTTSGLGFTDIGSYYTVGGIAKEFYQRVYQYYRANDKNKIETPEDYLKKIQPRLLTGGDVLSKMQWVFEPHVAEIILNDMLKKSGVVVVYGEILDLKSGVLKVGTNIQEIKMESGRTFSGKIFIDATYEGDLMAKSGISYTIGRESNDKYGETMNGSRVSINDFIDPYIVKGNPQSGLLPNIQITPPVHLGTSDNGIQAYNFRLCLTDDPESRIPISKPMSYNPSMYEVLARYFELHKDATIDSILRLSPLPNRSIDLNNNGDFSTDCVGKSYEWVESDYLTRERILKEHKDYICGLLWFLANDTRVPEKIRLEASKLGLSKREFIDNDNWPYQLYVREARRMVGNFIMTENVLTGKKKVSDPISIGSYAMDSHLINRYVDSGYVMSEGGMWKEVNPYQVSYMAIVPKIEECTNIFVPVCLSSSHAAYSSLRTEPELMMIAQSAAIAADLAIKLDVPVQRLPYNTLRGKLTESGQLIENKEAEIQSIELYSKFLGDKKIITSSDYWVKNAISGGKCSGDLVSSLITNYGQKFKSVSNIQEALEVMKENKIIVDTNYWSEHATKGNTCDGESVYKLFYNMVSGYQDNFYFVRTTM